ncbi:MAG: GNAT family N-acetyltransferase [Candidatus Bathyarchaeota archaeon]
MAVIVPFDSSIHMEQFRQLCIETYTWHREALMENHRIDFVSVLGKPIIELVDARLDSYLNVDPSQRALYLLESEGEAAGMGAIQKIKGDIGDIGMMYTRPQYRRRGYARQMLNRLLETGREMGCSTFWLRTPKFSFAPHLYRSVGFEERDYPESMRLHSELQPHWLFMEKIE